MFCTNCGTTLQENTKYCSNCGAASQSTTVNAASASGVAKKNLKTLSNNFAIGGIILILISALWWFSFYGAITSKMGANVTDAFSCLYSSNGVCAVASSMAQISGKTPYDPIVFWIGLIAAIAGGVIGKSPAEPSAKPDSGNLIMIVIVVLVLAGIAPIFIF